MSDLYILENGVPVKARSTLEWGRWFEENKDQKRVAYDEMRGCRISTVFLGMDHNWGEGPPILYETRIFGGEHDEWQERAATREEALQIHERAKALVGGMAS
jgi:hypothetical protein